MQLLSAGLRRLSEEPACTPCGCHTTPSDYAAAGLDNVELYYVPEGVAFEREGCYDADNSTDASTLNAGSTSGDEASAHPFLFREPCDDCVDGECFLNGFGFYHPAFECAAVLMASNSQRHPAHAPGLALPHPRAPPPHPPVCASDRSRRTVPHCHTNYMHPHTRTSPHAPTGITRRAAGYGTVAILRSWERSRATSAHLAFRRVLLLSTLQHSLLPRRRRSRRLRPRSPPSPRHPRRRRPSHPSPPPPCR